MRLRVSRTTRFPRILIRTDESIVVVVSGALTFGMGDKLVKGAAANKTLPVGGCATLMPANMNHFALRDRKRRPS